MTTFWERHKVKLILAAILVAVILSGIYLYAALRPGFWLRDAYLYEQKDGSFRGSDNRGQYTLLVQRNGSATIATMTINDITHIYEIRQNDTNVQILHDGEQIFDGYIVDYGSSYFLQDNNGNLTGFEVYAENGSYTTEELFPSCGWLFRCAHQQDLSTRGQPWMLALAWLCAAWIIVDICFPDLFFDLRYRWHIDGGEPNENYRAGQVFGRILMLIFIIVILIMGFAHQ